MQDENEFDGSQVESKTEWLETEFTIGERDVTITPTWEEVTSGWLSRQGPSDNATFPYGDRIVECKLDTIISETDGKNESGSHHFSNARFQDTGELLTPEEVYEMLLAFHGKTLSITLIAKE